MKRNTIIKGIAFLHIITAAGIALFWISFYSGLIFPMDQLAPRISNFAGYYAWETAFTIPDSILALTMLAGGIMVLKDMDNRKGRLLLIAASGGATFLGVLDFVYDFGNGMYNLDHIFSYILLEVGIFLPLLGIGTIAYFIKSDGN